MKIINDKNIVSKYLIYVIKNTINSKIYIGKTKNLKQRLYKHEYLSKKSNRYLYTSIRKYGIENFYCEIIDGAETIDKINSLEKEYIKKHNSTNSDFGFNTTAGGDGGDTWTLNKNKEILSKKLSELHKGRVCSDETKKKISLANKGKTISYEQRSKISKTLKEKYKNKELIYNGCFEKYLGNRKGEKHSDETKNKISIARKGKTYAEIYKDEKIVNELKEKRKKNFSGKNNPKYKEVDKTQLLKMILEEKTNIEIAKFFCVTQATIIAKAKLFFGKTPTQIKKEKKTYEDII